MNLSLRSKIALIGSGAILLAILTVVTVSGWMFRESYTTALESRSTAVARGLALQLERIVQLGIRPTELVGFEMQLSEAAKAYEGISWAFMATQSGQLLARSHDAPVGNAFANPTLLGALKNGARQVIQLHDGPRRIHVALEPVRTPADFTPVMIGVVLDSAALMGNVRQLQLAGWLAGLAALVAGVLILILATTRFVTRPLSTFVATMDRIRRDGSGVNLGLRASHDSNDEVGVMVQGFNTLLDQIAQRDAALIEAQRAADAANRAKSHFLATVSHELRTPMHAVLGMNELLLRTELSAKQRRFASTVQESAKTLLAHINDILDFSRIEAGHLSLEEIEFDPVHTVEEVVTLLAPQAQRAHLDLAWRVSRNVPSRLVGDPVRIGQMLTNLIGNALKFTARGGVLVDVTRDDERIRFCVSDTGIGVDPATVPQLFEAFKQADDSFARRYGGSGLGLSIVRELADAMGGEAGGTGTLGAGASFWFSIRLRALAEPPRGNAHADIGAHMLLASPLPMTARAIQAAAEERGIRVSMATDVAAAQVAVRNATLPLDLVVIADHQPPAELDALTRALPPGTHVVCLVGDHIEAPSLHPVPPHVDVLTLPINPGQLFAQGIRARGAQPPVLPVDPTPP